MTVLRTKRLSNPRRVAVRGNKGASRKPKMTPRQIKFFGTKRQRAALKAKRHSPRTVPSTKRSPNPSLLVTLGPVMNPHRRSKATMPAKAKKYKTNKKRTVASNRRRVAKSNAHRPRTRPKTRTITKTVVRYRSKPNKRHRTNPRRTVMVVKNRRRRAKNPSLFGSSLTSKQGLTILGGGFTGLVAAKFIPTLLPASMTGSLGSSGGGRFVLTLGSALVAAWAAGKFVGGAFGDGVLFGGLIQAGSVALNAFLPSVYSSLGIGLGDLLPGQFTVPQNPIRAGMAPPALPAPKPGAQGGQARVTMSGLARAYGNAY